MLQMNEQVMCTFLLITASQLAPASASGNFEVFVSTVFISFYFPTSR